MLTEIRSSLRPRILVIGALWGLFQLFKPLSLDSRTATTRSGSGAPPFRALFIGNSYTYFNDLPVVIRDLAAAAKEQRPFEPHVVVVGGSTLQAHIERRTALDAIAQGKWDVVVLQEQSTRPITDPLLMQRDVRTFADAAAKSGAKLVLYETWAREVKPETQDSLSHVYHAAASAVGATIVHAGDAWSAFRSQEGSVPEGSHSVLFREDGAHPTPTGTYLVANVMYATFYGRSPVGLPSVTRNTTVQPPPGPAPDAPRDSVNVKNVKTIQELAWRAAHP